MAGETGAVVSKLTLPMASVIGGLLGIAVYNSFEVYISIFRTFRRRRGLYFWSAIVANTGIPVNSLFVLLRYFNIASAGPMAAMMVVGWLTMVNGQPLMLYSRLHLVMDDPKHLRWLLWMIIVPFVLLQIPTGVLFIFISFRYNSRNPTINAFDVMEITQLVTLALQEGLKVRKVLRELIWLFVLVAALDVSLIIIQFLDLYYIQTTYKPVVYSIKLKVEIFVLNNLITLVSQQGCSCQLAGFPSDGSAATNNTRPSGSNVSCPPRYTSSERVTENVDRRGTSSCAGIGSVSTAWTGNVDRTKTFKRMCTDDKLMRVNISQQAEYRRSSPWLVMSFRNGVSVLPHTLFPIITDLDGSVAKAGVSPAAVECRSCPNGGFLTGFGPSYDAERRYRNKSSRLVEAIRTTAIMLDILPINLHTYPVPNILGKPWSVMIAIYQTSACLLEGRCKRQPCVRHCNYYITSAPYISEFKEPFVEQWAEQHQTSDGIVIRHVAAPFVGNPLTVLGAGLASVPPLLVTCHEP
ncbi:hypothetical protein CHU98_g301 [Xylaria longipes]|nr:hypothetical protein CHU98_g301 [Xylaria longipes]